MMNEKYMIIIKEIKNKLDEPSECWKYAGINKTIYANGYPCWTPFEMLGEVFHSIEDAENWFNQAKMYLFDEVVYNHSRFDMSTLSIIKVTHVKRLYN